MAIKAGELIHVGNQVLIDRIQTGGPGNLNIPTEKINELGNYESVATTRDIADLTFTMESLDVSAEVEATLLARDYGALAQGAMLDLAAARPMDVVGQIKAGKTAANPFNVVASVAVPFLTLESASYRFGLRDNASQNFGLRGDSIFYAGGSSYVEEETGSGAGGQAVPFTNAPIPYNGDVLAGTRYALAVTLVNSGKRLVLGAEYTETASGVTVVEAVPATETIRVVYQSAVVAAYPQASHAVASATRPAAIKGKDIEIRVGGNTVTDRWSSIQSATIDWRVTLDRDEEFGNAQIVAQDFDVPAVTGTVEIKARSAEEMLAKIRQIAGVAAGQVIGPYSSTPMPLDVLLHSPVNGAVLKTLHVPDARFTLPGYSGRVQTKLTQSFPFESDGGVLRIYRGARA